MVTFKSGFHYVCSYSIGSFLRRIKGQNNIFFGDVRQLAKNKIPRATTRDCPYKPSIIIVGAILYGCP